MSFIQFFLNEHKPLIKPRFVAVEEDWEKLCMIFPEPGFRSYFLGHIVSKLVKELKDHGIESYSDRESRPECASLTRLLSNVQLIRDKDNSDDGRTARGLHEESASSSGEPTNFKIIVGGEEGDDKVEEGTGETGLEPIRLVVPADQFPFSAEDIKRHLAQ